MKRFRWAEAGGAVKWTGVFLLIMGWGVPAASLAINTVLLSLGIFMIIAGGRMQTKKYRCPQCGEQMQLESRPDRNFSYRPFCGREIYPPER